MSRRPRLKLDGIPIHIIQRGNNRNACFYTDEDYQFYLESLDGYCHDEKVKARVGWSELANSNISETTFNQSFKTG